MVDFLDINLLNVFLVLPKEIHPCLVYHAPIPVFIGRREVGTAVYEPDTDKGILRIRFHEPGDYKELAYKYPACETEPVAEPSGQTRFAIAKILYASLPLPTPTTTATKRW